MPADRQTCDVFDSLIAVNREVISRSPCAVESGFAGASTTAPSRFLPSALFPLATFVQALAS